MRLTRHSSDSTAFEAPVNSSQHGVSVPGQLVIRFWAVTSWPCDELTGTRRTRQLHGECRTGKFAGKDRRSTSVLRNQPVKITVD